MTVFDDIAKILARYPDASKDDAEELANELEEEILALEDTTAETVIHYEHLLLREAFASKLRDRDRIDEEPAKKKMPRRRRDRRMAIVEGMSNGYVDLSVEDLREQMLSDEIEALLDKTFVPGRGITVTWRKATEAEHRARVLTQEAMGDAVYEDAQLHRLFAESIRVSEGARCYDDVRKTWRRRK